jgi:hypothetical protein
MQARRQREHPTFLPIEPDPLPADLPIEPDPPPTWLWVAPHVEPERSAKFPWIGLGVVVLFGAVIGGGYWHIRRWQPPVSEVAYSPPKAPAKPAPAVAVPPATPLVPRLAVGIPALRGQATTASVSAQPPLSAPSQPPQLAVGLRPISGQLPSDASALEPAAEAPPPAEPLSSPAPPPKPHRKAANPQSSPVANPSVSSGFVKF